MHTPQVLLVVPLDCLMFASCSGTTLQLVHLGPSTLAQRRTAALAPPHLAHPPLEASPVAAFPGAADHHHHHHQHNHHNHHGYSHHGRPSNMTGGGTGSTGASSATHGGTSMHGAHHSHHHGHHNHRPLLPGGLPVPLGHMGIVPRMPLLLLHGFTQSAVAAATVGAGVGAEEPTSVAGVSASTSGSSSSGDSSPGATTPGATAPEASGRQEPWLYPTATTTSFAVAAAAGDRPPGHALRAHQQQQQPQQQQHGNHQQAAQPGGSRAHPAGSPAAAAAGLAAFNPLLLHGSSVPGWLGVTKLETVSAESAAKMAALMRGLFRQQEERRNAGSCGMLGF